MPCLCDHNESCPICKDLHATMANKDMDFKKHLLKSFGVEHNPKAERCFLLAWEYGHSAGYSEVEGYFTDLVELIK